MSDDVLREALERFIHLAAYCPVEQLPAAIKDAYDNGRKVLALTRPPSAGEAEPASREQRLAAAIVWALGYTDFRPRREGEGGYWWRKELRDRSGLTPDECNAIAGAGPTSGAPE